MDAGSPTRGWEGCVPPRRTATIIQNSHASCVRREGLVSTLLSFSRSMIAASAAANGVQWSSGRQRQQKDSQRCIRRVRLPPCTAEPGVRGRACRHAAWRAQWARATHTDADVRGPAARRLGHAPPACAQHRACAFCGRSSRSSPPWPSPLPPSLPACATTSALTAPTGRAIASAPATTRCACLRETAQKPAARR